MVNCDHELKTERDATSLDCAVVNKQPKDRNVQRKLKQKLDTRIRGTGAIWRMEARGTDGRGGRLFFPTELQKMCVHLKKSWLRPCLLFNITLSLHALTGLITAENFPALS